MKILRPDTCGVGTQDHFSACGLEVKRGNLCAEQDRISRPFPPFLIFLRLFAAERAGVKAARLKSSIKKRMGGRVDRWSLMAT